MSNSTLSQLILAFGITLIFPALSGCCREKGPPPLHYSASEEESKKNKVFEFEVIADKQEIILDSIHSFRIDDAWVENGWYKICKWYGWKIEKVPSNQLMMRLRVVGLKNVDDFPFYFLGTQHLDTLVHFYCNRIDTIKIPLYRENTPYLEGKKERQAFDSITFIKK